MKTRSIGLIGIILGGLFLSLELYLLKMIQLMEKAGGAWYENVWHYAAQFPCNAALLITAGVVAFLAAVFFSAREQ